MTGLHYLKKFDACRRQSEPQNFELVSGVMSDSSANSCRVPHYHPALVEIWTDRRINRPHKFIAATTKEKTGGI
jgi:hypothetical protein